MRRLLRWALNFSAAVSAVLFVATCVLWVRSTRTTAPAAVRFWVGPELWEVAVQYGGRVSLDNEPQRDLDREPERKLKDRQNTLLRSSRDELQRSNQYRAQAYQRPDWRPDDGGFLRKSAAAQSKAREASDEAFRYAAVLRRSPFPVAPLRRYSLGLEWVAAAFALPPATWLIVAGFRAGFAGTRRRHGLCPNCGYDLRATPSRCPECGAVPGHPKLPMRQSQSN